MSFQEGSGNIKQLDSRQFDMALYNAQYNAQLYMDASRVRLHQKDMMIHNLQSKIVALEAELRTRAYNGKTLECIQEEAKSPLHDLDVVEGEVEGEACGQVLVDEQGLQQELAASVGSPRDTAELRQRCELTNSLAMATQQYQSATDMLQSWENEVTSEKRRRGKRTRRGSSY